jgi:uncharacterized protein (TIGR02757 family)
VHASSIKKLLNEAVDRYNRPEFIHDDPICIPHQFKHLPDIEIMGLWTAVLSWGQRKTILTKASELIDLMDGVPYRFIMDHKETDLKRFLHFKHRTFNATDTLYFIHFFKWYYSQFDSLEAAFYSPEFKSDADTGRMINRFRQLFFSLEDAPFRTRKHIASPDMKSTCKRINMFLRWMVRSDGKGVDLGVWKQIQPAQLICPLDVHVDRVARRLGLLSRRQTDWFSAVELTQNLRIIDPDDPVKFDFALFGLGVYEKPA